MVGPDSSNNPNQYTSRENDGTGLYYYRARYYDPVLKVFLSEDPLGLEAGPNVRGYVGGNPLTYIDPTGEFGIPIFTGAVGAIAGGVSNYMVQKYYQKKCDVAWLDVLNAAAWGGAAGAALPFVGSTLFGAAALGSAANVGQYATSLAWSSDGFSAGSLAWSAGMGAISGGLGGTFSRAMGYPGGYYGTIGTALAEVAQRAKDAATIGANSGFINGVRNGAAGVMGSLPQEGASGTCGCNN